MASLHWADYVIFAGFLCISLGIGIYHAFSGGKQRTVQEFIMADRKLSVIPTMLSLLVSYQSAIMILGHTAEMYTRGAQAWPMMIIFYATAILLGERIIVPWLYPLKLTSVYKYFLLRFNSKIVQVYAAFLGVLTGVLYMGVSMYAPAVALETASGFPIFISIPIMAVVAVAYTALGGMKAVIWTDVLQFVVMFCGILAILIKASMLSGGVTHALEVNRMEGRLNWLNIDPDPTVRHTLWSFMFGWTLNMMTAYSLQQASVQRYTATGSLRNARLTLLLNIPVLAGMVSMTCLSGICIFAYYAEVVKCDPLASKTIYSPNQILPDFVRREFSGNIGFAGLFLATLYSGALSSVSSILSACAANTWEDILRQIPYLDKISDSKAAIINRVLVVVFGAIATGFAFLSALVPGPITQVSIALAASSGGPLCGMFLIAGVFRLTEWKGAALGGIVGFAINLWVNIGAMGVKGQHPRLPPASVESCQPNITLTVADPKVFGGLERFYTLSYLWYVPMGIIVTLIVGLSVSALSRCCGWIDEEAEQKIPKSAFIRWRSACTWAELPDSDDETDAVATEKDTEKKDLDFDNPGFSPDNSISDSIGGGASAQQ